MKKSPILQYHKPHVPHFNSGECVLSSLAFKLLARENMAFYMKQDFSAALGFPHPTLSMVKCSLGFLSEFIDSKQRSLDFEGHAWNWGKFGDIHTIMYIHTYKHIYIQDSSKADGIGLRQPSLVMYASWISLLQILVASQQFHLKQSTCFLTIPWFSTGTKNDRHARCA